MPLLPAQLPKLRPQDRVPKTKYCLEGSSIVEATQPANARSLALQRGACKLRRKCNQFPCRICQTPWQDTGQCGKSWISWAAASSRTAVTPRAERAKARASTWRLHLPVLHVAGSALLPGRHDQVPGSAAFRQEGAHLFRTDAQAQAAAHLADSALSSGAPTRLPAAASGAVQATCLGVTGQTQ